jgi:hypothetical protein
MRPSISSWVHRCYSESVDDWSGVLLPNMLHELELRLQVPLPWGRGDTGARGALLTAMFANEEFGLDTLDCILSMLSRAIQHGGNAGQTASTLAVQLDGILEQAGSAWRIGFLNDDTLCLERRVPDAVADQYAELARQRLRSSEHLRLAWHAAYGRGPDASKAYRESVKAVESAARGIVIPTDPRATLGLIIAAMRDAPHKWRMRFTEPGIDPIPVVVETMKLIWTSQIDRHGTDESAPLSVTLDEAHDALHIAITLVQLFECGAITRVE